MTVQLQEQLSAADAEVILERLPERIRTALIAHAAEIEYPIEAVVEMAHSPKARSLRVRKLSGHGSFEIR